MKKRWLALMVLLGLLLAVPVWAASQVFTEHTIKGDFDEALSVYATDVDGDGDVDVLGAAFTADDITWWENDGATPPGWTEHTIKGDFNGVYSVYATDVDGDGHVDVLGAAVFADDITWFEQRICYTLTTNVNPSGSGSVDLNPSPNCAGGKYIEDTVVTLTAVPNATWQFDQWSGDKTGTANPTTVTMDSDKSVTANFERIIWKVYLPLIMRNY